MPSRLSTWSRAVLAAAVVLLPGVAVAQVPPILVIGDAGTVQVIRLGD